MPTTIDKGRWAGFHWTKRIVINLLFAIPLLWTSGACADPKAEAGRHFDRAIHFLDDGRVVEAIDAFKRSFDTLPNPKVLYNLGQAYVAIDKPVEAIGALRRYLNEVGPAVPSQRRSDVEKEIALQESRVAIVTIRTTPEGASIGVNGREIGTSPLATPALMVPGEYRLSATLDGYDAVERPLTLAAGDRKAIEIELVSRGGARAGSPLHRESPDNQARAAWPGPLPALGQAAGANVEEGGSSKTRTFMHIAGIAVAGIGVVTCATSVAFFLQKQSANDRAVAQALAGEWDAAYTSMADAENLEHWNIGTAVVGGALIVGGAALYVFAPSRRPPMSSKLNFQPMLGQSVVGVSARGAW